jgi:hypothetical protein
MFSCIFTQFHTSFRYRIRGYVLAEEDQKVLEFNQAGEYVINEQA